MNKISLIIQREYLSRVKKKSFLIMTILGPLLMGSIFLIPVLLAQYSDEQKTIAVIDNSGLFEGKLNDNEDIKFLFLKTNLDDAKKEMRNKEYDAIVNIPNSIISNPQSVTMF